MARQALSISHRPRSSQQGAHHWMTEDIHGPLGRGKYVSSARVGVSSAMSAILPGPMNIKRERRLMESDTR